MFVFNDLQKKDQVQNKVDTFNCNNKIIKQLQNILIFTPTVSTLYWTLTISG